MKIESPKVSLLEQTDEVSHIANCVRVCYASDKTTDSQRLYDSLWANNHRSMFRHAGVYYIIPTLEVSHTACFSSEFCNVYYSEFYLYVSTNRQFAREYLYDYAKYEVDYITAYNTEVFYKNKMLYYSFIIDTGIDITRKYNCKSPNSIAERSTRYVDFIKKIGIQFKHCHWMSNLSIYKFCLVKLMCKVDEWFYKISRSKYGLNLKPEDARWCLFLDTMSRAVYTYTVKDWEYIINIKLFDYTGKAHPDAKVVAKQIKTILEEEGYSINNYKEKYKGNGSC